MPASILTVVLVLLFLSVFTALIAVTVLVTHIRGERELLVAREREHAEETRYLVRALIAKHAGEFVQLEHADSLTERTAQHFEFLGGTRDAIFDDGLRDPETDEIITPVGMTG